METIDEYIEANLVHSIHVSERRSFRGCRRRWSWIFQDLWYPPMTAKPLEFGIAYHKACEFWYDPDFWGNDRDIRKIETLHVFRVECEKQLKEFTRGVREGKIQQFQTDEEVAQDYKERIELGQGMLQEMFKTSAELDHDTYTPVGVEVKFEVPIKTEEDQTIWCRCNRCKKKYLAWMKSEGRFDYYAETSLSNDPVSYWQTWKGLPVTYGGRIDMLAQDIYGRYWIFDWKLLTVTEPVLTPMGWVPIGDLKDGEWVIGRNGKPVQILGASPVSVHDVWEVMWTDGTVVECASDHKWTVYNYDNKLVTVTTEELARVRRPATPTNDVVEFTFSGPKPMHPYVLGMLIGDGHFKRQLAFSSKSGESVEWLREFQDADVLIEDQRQFGNNKWVIKGPWKKQLEDLGLWEKLSAEKFIPKSYMFASVEDRLNLLRGLYDTDGLKSTLRFCTISKQLAEDVANLVRSLGGKASISSSKARLHTNGTTQNAAEYFVNFWLRGFSSHKWPTPEGDKKGSHRRAIASVRKTDRTAEMRCIAVAAADNLYITRDYVVTHNTAARLSTGDPGSPDDYLWFDDQITSYCWALWTLGIDVAGFVYHEQKKKAMAEEPEPLKRPYKGALYSQNRQKTYDYEVYKTTVSENDPQGFAAGLYDEYIQFLEENNVFYKRHTITRNQAELEAAGVQIAWEAEEITNPNLRIYKSSGRFSCGFCAFKEPCLAYDRGEDYLYTLESLFEKREKLYYETAASNTDKPNKG